MITDQSNCGVTVIHSANGGPTASAFASKMDAALGWIAFSYVQVTRACSDTKEAANAPFSRGYFREQA